MMRYSYIFLIGFIFLSYFLLIEEDYIESSPALTQESYTPKQPITTKTGEFEKATYTNRSINDEKNNNDENIIERMNEILSGKTPNLSLSYVEKLKDCDECLNKISGKVIDNQLSREEVVRLLNTLTSENDPEVAKMLLNALSQVLAQEGYGERGDLILSSIANFDSPEIASILSEYLIELSINGNTSNLTALQDGLRKVIRQTTDSHQVGSNLAQTFFSANTTQAQEQILAINHPDALVQISLESLNQGDVTTFQTVTNRLQQNNSHTTPDAILTLYRKQADTNYQAEAIANLAKAWAQQNATGASLDILEEKLVSGILPEGEQALVLSMLEHSIDPRGKSILEKYQSNSQ